MNGRRSLKAAEDAWSILTPDSITDRDTTRAAETERRHKQEIERKDLLVVQVLEKKLNIARRWGPEDAEWREAAIMVGKRRYQRCLDSLEGLIVSRMFELTKMNMSQTGKCPVLTPSLIMLTALLGYKLRKHIGNALKARSQAVRTALENYNASARALVPPRAELSWDNVVEYAFLADFDLLADTREDVRL